jgi:pimeloyl-ACP methyl ester carboxylesterase
MNFFDEAKSSEKHEKVAVLPNRTVLCKRRSSQIRIDDDDISPIVNILFVHGSCASSSQYDDLIHALEIQVTYMVKSEKLQISKINYFSYDQLGCAGSKHPADDWEAFSSANLLQDLQSIVQNGILPNSKASSPLFIVGHSHGCSQVIQLVNSLSDSNRDRIKGLVLIGGALKDGPGGLARDGGHWIFKYVPMFMLRKMQPSLSQGFFDAAVHPKNRERLRESAINVSNTNDMLFCKAFYRQQVYASSEEASKLKVSFHKHY